MEETSTPKEACEQINCLAGGFPGNVSPADNSKLDTKDGAKLPSGEPLLPEDSNNNMQKPIENSEREPDMDFQDILIEDKEKLASPQGLSRLSEPHLPKTSEMISKLEFFEVARRHCLPDPVAKRMKLNIDDENDKRSVNHIIKGIAEIVMVLAGLGQIRAQRPPSVVERELQIEAYASLAFLVQNLAPTDVVGKKSIENLIEELDLRRTNKRVEPISVITDMQGTSIEKVSYAMNDEKEPELHDHMIPESVMYLDPAIPTVEEAMLGEEEDKASAPYLASTPDSSSTADAGHMQAEAAGSTHRQLTQAMQQWIRSNTRKVQPLSHTSKPYMAVPMPCELCKLIVKDTVSVLICDACERAYHLKCLQLYRVRERPEGDWYCPNCLLEAQGQPQIPKYGRVKPGTTFFSNSTSVGESQEERVLIRVQAQGRLPEQPTNVSSVPGTVVETTLTEAIDKQGGKRDGSISPEGIDRVADRLLGLASTQTVLQGRLRGALQSSGKNIPALLNSTQAEALHQNIVTVGQSSIQSPDLRASQTQLGTFIMSQNSEKMLQKEGSRFRQETGAPLTSQPMKISLEGLVNQNDVALDVAVNRSGQDGSVEDVDQFVVEWLGDMIHLSDGKMFYSSCRVGDFVYKLQDYALFRPETPDIPPYIARLQSLWEDNVTGSKWVRVNWCYYPTDIPAVVSRPSNTEANEVYESNHGDNNLVGSMQGPCLVLRPEKYFKEIERRRELLRNGHTSEGLFPIFLCRWLYDAPRGIFRPAI